MKAVIMAGGFGTRLRPLTMTIPKPMVPLLNKPIMEHIINLLKNHGINNIVSLLYFHPEIITSYFQNGEKFGVSLNYIIAQADYGTAGAVKNAYQYLDEPFIVISGDVLTDFDLTQAINFHKEKHSLATILLTRSSLPLQYGIVITDDNDRITRFLEKPSWGQVFSDTINTGIYILEPEVLDLIPYQEEFDFGKDLFPLMLEKKMPLYGYVANGYWRDIGNLEEYLIGQKDALAGKVKLNISSNLYESYYGYSDTEVANNVEIKGNVYLGHNTKISSNCVLKDSIIGNNVTIGTGSKLYGVVIWDNVKIGEFCDINNTVICNNVNIGHSTTISENVFIAENCNIGPNVYINPNIKLWPNKIIEEGAMVTHTLVQEERWNKELFTGPRISALSNVDIYPEFAAKLGACIGMAFKRNSNFLTSRDPDPFSRIIKRSMVAGLTSVGVNVNDLQMMSIPQTRQELRTGKYSGGFHTRRSPRNPDNTDIIIFSADGRDISISKAKSIERYFFGEDISRVHYKDIGKIRFPERTNEIYLNRYMDSLEVDLIRSKHFKILMDYSFGLASSILPQVLGDLGVDVISLNNYIDPQKFRKDPAEIQQEYDEISKIMQSISYELGFRIEPGAEKISIIDERGVWYSHQRLLTIMTKLFLETHRHKEPYKIAISILGSKEVDLIAQNYNVEIIHIKDSHSAMMEATTDEKVLFVGNIHGGFIFRDFLYASDGMFSIGQVLEMLSKTGLKISEIDKQLPRRCYKSTEIKIPWEMKGYIMRRAMQYSESYPRELVEGVKIFYGDNSVVLLPNSEGASFFIYADAQNTLICDELIEEHTDLINKWKEEF
ncbi:MAG TPA: sugar phosphate nucleotidyltransferase [Bacteroidota bacterium]|nr:sugar phosphate nucleotidyltransferase [Bacteroidota bacterium]